MERFISMEHFSIYHNPRCSKSRQTLNLMKEKGINPTIILYLENKPKVNELKKILDLMNMKPRELLRKGEDDYKIFNLNDSSKSDEEILKIMSENPKLIERPIVVTDNKAVIGRPPENIFKILK